ncbi:MAG: PQQ-binding-like beta-propeller repeat protein [Candidatus Eisenbacteria bacterium]|nr:PQQ-binding-like beta-propeller repeat protein [Candidatus Eisenbacteria bacterium]
MIRSTLRNAGLLLALWCTAGDAATVAATWPMKQRDMHHTGRADYTVPPERMNGTFFDVFLWQKPAPNSPGEGYLGATSMTFFDGAGPGGTDAVLGTYHWPKGVMAMDRHSGAGLWSGLPAGGEGIANITPAFSNDGASIYVVNDATADPQWPNGHPFMAFATATGPGTYHHNGADPVPDHLSARSPVVAPDGRIFLYQWFDRAYAGTDDGNSLAESWAADTANQTCWGEPALYQDGALLRAVVGGRAANLRCYDGATGGSLWSRDLPAVVEAGATVDPANGNLYVAVGEEDIWVAGFGRTGALLWSTATLLVYDYQPGMNEPERAQSAGCLGHDGATYYFQTVGQSGNGALYAINTADGTLKWRLPTRSRGWADTEVSCPVVTPNGVVIVGNNEGDTYYAVQDAGVQGVMLDSLVVASDGDARASATLSPEGLLYLPLRTWWLASNGDGQTPTAQVENLFCALDLRVGAVATLPAPAWPVARALNNAVLVQWRRMPDPGGAFDHYAVYRASAPFTDVSAMAPIATVADIADTDHVDATAANGVSYHYAVTTVSTTGGEVDSVRSIGPRTPFDQTDLQVVAIARTPRYPRYWADYTNYEQSEPSGFGPYAFSASTSLGGGQSGSTQRWPGSGDPVTWTATVRNRGSNPWSGALAYTWLLDGAPVSGAAPAVSLAPGEEAAFACVLPWDGLPHTVKFAMSPTDARPGNDSLSVGTKSVAFLSYVDVNCLEGFREATSQYGNPATDDMLDWIQRHMRRFNQLFAGAGTGKRVHYDVLQVVRDGDPDPATDWIDFASFPNRFRVGDDYRLLSGYYDAAEDLDYGYLHEMGHQLGLIDLYQLDVSAAINQVSGTAYSAPPDLMNGCSHFLSPHSALAMEHWLDDAHGYYGQYLYGIPSLVKLRFLGLDGGPLAGAAVKVYQLCERPGLGKAITSQVKFQGTTDANGVFELPNVPVDQGIVPPAWTGDTLRANPFGYVAVVGTNSVLHFKVESGGFTDWAWLDITEANVAWYQGQRDSATFERPLALGGLVQSNPPEDLTEMNAGDWYGWAEGGAPGGTTMGDDTQLKRIGAGAIHFVTDGGFDTYARYPNGFLARWDATPFDSLTVWYYAINNDGFQNGSPWIVLRDQDGVSIRYQYYLGGAPYDLLNDARGVWQRWAIPLDASPVEENGWRRTVTGAPDMTRITSVELHADTWDYGFELWLDGVGFVVTPGVSVGDPLDARPAGWTSFANPYPAGAPILLQAGSRNRVETAIYDVTGRRVKTLVDGAVLSGVQRLAWDGRGTDGRAAAAGIYFVRVRVGSVEATAKLALVR